MKNSELIAILRDCDPDAEVFMGDGLSSADEMYRLGTAECGAWEISNNDFADQLVWTETELKQDWVLDEAEAMMRQNPAVILRGA